LEEIKVQEEISQENIKNSQSIVTLHGDNSEISDNILSQKNTEFPIPPQYLKSLKAMIRPSLKSLQFLLL